MHELCNILLLFPLIQSAFLDCQIWFWMNALAVNQKHTGHRPFINHNPNHVMRKSISVTNAVLLSLLLVFPAASSLPWWSTQQQRQQQQQRYYHVTKSLFDPSRLRGGAVEEEETETVASHVTSSDAKTLSPFSASSSSSTKRWPNKFIRKVKRRRTSDIILNLIDPSSSSSLWSGSSDTELSHDLRSLIMERRDELTLDLQNEVAAASNQPADGRTSAKDDRVGAVKRLLHILAPKIPAIRYSPDVALRVRSLPSDADAGLAASLVATLAHLWEVQDLSRSSSSSSSSSSTATTTTCVPAFSTNNNATALVATELVNDRRFEQLIETIVCGVDISRRKKEALTLHMQHETDDLVRMIKDSKVDDGLCIRDACRAAWGIAMLGLHDVKYIADTNIHDLLVALSLRTRELLLGRVRLLCQDDFYVENNSTASVEERIMEIAQEIAEDTAVAMWVFGCVQAVTGIKSAPLIHVCTSILCHDPFQLRQNVQEAEPTLEEARVGGSDVIDKLERAERSENSSPSLLSKRNEDVFLDWLSPTEVTDVLWAVAIYGTKESSMMSSIRVLTDIAVDRVMEWLSHDLELAKPELTSKPADSDSHVGAVDSSEELQGPGDDIDVTDQNIYDSPDEDELSKDFELVEVVDAATLLASEHGHHEYEKEEAIAETNVDMHSIQSDSPVSAVLDSASMDAESVEMVDAAVLLEAEEAIENGPRKPSGSESDPIQKYLSRTESIDWLFSAHDLCSLTWAATELDDSLKSRTTEMVSELLVHMGEDSLKECSGADFSNLVWAIAKESMEQSSTRNPNYAKLGLWIAENVYRKSGIADAVIESDSWSLLRQFQPPELSRLLWSLASLSMTVEDKHLSSLVGVLSLAGLETASRNFHVFSTEDLTRICWAFVEYSDYDAVLKAHPLSLRSLGKVLGLIDISLTNWETGHLYKHARKEEEDHEHRKEAFRFISFFGRARSHISKFERKHEEVVDDLEDFPLPSLLAEKARLPLLKHLPVDPSTLCRLCGSLNRRDVQYSEVCDTHSIVKVTLRLMTSRSGRLLRECHINDLTSLCVAAACATSSANREIVGLFARRAVKVLNDNPSLLKVATPPILVKLLGALGELGVKYHPEDVSPTSYRRLQLSSKLPFEESFSTDSLSNDSLLNMVRGLALMNATQDEETIVARALEELDSRFLDFAEEVSKLDDLLETIVHFRPSLADLVQNATEGNRTEVEIEEDPPESSTEKISEHTANLLYKIAATAVERIRLLKSDEIRRMLQYFVALPYPVDDLIEAIDEEIKRRQDATSRHSVAISAMRDAIRKMPLESFLEQLEKSKNPSKLFRKLVRSLSEDKKGPGGEIKDDEAQNDNTEDDSTAADKILDIILAAANVRDQDLDFPTTNADPVEYGRIYELIAQYKRIDFESGALLSVFDKQGQRLMAKRMMSRLLP